MADEVDAVTRSRMMSGIRGTNTKPELRIRKLLHRAGFRFRIHARDLPGRPDIVLPRWRAAIFVHGCFWHGHDCHLFRMPGTRQEFWSGKIGRNRAGDVRAAAALAGAGWRFAVVWECALKGRTRMTDDAVAVALEKWLRGRRRLLTLRGKK
jgi:DNA mismatch endonuclease (patch repair protein)